MLKMIVAGAGALCLCGCVTTQEQIMAQDDATCRSWGVQPGSSPYVECRVLLSQQHAMQDAQRRDALAAAGLILLSR